MKRIYEGICRGIELDDFEIGNRPKNMALGYDKKLRYIAPQSCLPYTGDELSELCEVDIKKLKTQYGRIYGRIKEVMDNAQEVVNYFGNHSFLAQHYYQEFKDFTDLSAKEYNELALPVLKRNLAFIGFIYSQLNNIGNCQSLVDQLTVGFAKKIKFANLKIISVSQTKYQPSKLADTWQSQIKDHVFLLIDSSVPTGKYSGGKNVQIADKLKEGYVCDTWRKDTVFAPLRDLIKKDPLYDVKNWDEIKVEDVSLPKFYSDEELSGFEDVDFISNPGKFLTMFFNSKEARKAKLWKNLLFDKKTNRKKAQEKIKELILPAKKKQVKPSHNEL